MPGTSPRPRKRRKRRVRFSEVLEEIRQKDARPEATEAIVLPDAVIAPKMEHI